MAKKYKITIPSTNAVKKVVVLRDMVVGDQETAAELANVNEKSSPIVAVMKTQNELVKLLLEEVDGKKLTGAAKENLKELFSVQEMNHLVKFVAQLSSTEGEPSVEVITE